MHANLKQLFVKINIVTTEIISCLSRFQRTCESINNVVLLLDGLEETTKESGC